LQRTQRILERLPSFYKTWDPTSLLFKVVCSLAKRLDEAQKDLVAILRAHWVDKALTLDIDHLGALYNMTRNPGETDVEYRNRLKLAIMEYKGGGTRSAVLTAVTTVLRLPRDYPLELVENPPKETHWEVQVRTGESWWQSSESVVDATPRIEIQVATDGGKVTNPTLVNTDLEASLTFQGTMQSGEVLHIEDGKAILNGEDVTGRLTTSTVPKLLRRGSTWRYTELLEQAIGVFDVARFDEAIFPVGIAAVRIGFQWVAYQPATFELRIPKDALSRRGDLPWVRAVVDSIKAAGVQALVHVVDG
jgi:hypothetical protein